MNAHVRNLSPLAVTDPKIGEQLQFAGLRFMITRADLLKSEALNAGAWLARPSVVGVVLLYTVLWLIFDPGQFGWHGVATIASLLMTLFIQRSEHHDSDRTREAGRTVAGKWWGTKSAY